MSTHATPPDPPPAAGGWEQLVKPPLAAVGAYAPGPSVSELMAAHGLSEVVKLNWNEGLWGPLPGVLEAVAGALDKAWAYPEHAYDALREAIAADTGARPEAVLPGHGIQALILTLVSAFVRPGDTVVVPQPTYGLYAQACGVAGAVIEPVPLSGWRLDLQHTAAAVRRTGARMVWICDPNNPTGSLVAPDEWRAFLDGVGPDCVVVADEAYMDYVAPEARLPRLQDIAEGRRVVILRTFSKLFGLAGLRLGYLVADPELVRFLLSVQEPFNVNRAALAGGLASLGRPDAVAARRAELVAARTRFAAVLRAGGLETPPSAGNFVFTAVGVDDRALAEGMLRRGFLIRTGTELGAPGWVRITIAPEPVMERAAAALLDVRGDLLSV